MRALPTLSVDDRPRFHSNIPISELAERNTQADEESVISLAPLVAETEDGVTHETRPTPTEPHGARGLEPPDPRSIGRGSKAAHEGPEAASHQTEPGGKKQMSLSSLCPSCLEANKVISTFSFDPSL